MKLTKARPIPKDTEAELRAEIVRLQHIIDSRPAINAALPDSYIRWSQSIYSMEMQGDRKPS